MAEKSTIEPGTQDGSDESVEYWKSEAKKAFTARDRVRSQLSELEAKATLTQEERARLDELTKQQSEAEEQRKIAQGEYESLKAAILKEKSEAIAAKEAAEQRYAQRSVEAAFANASDLFGPNGITTLTPEFAYAGMRGHVDFVPGTDGKPDRIVVRNMSGGVISKDGEPVPFAEGMRQLIDEWPSKEHILRAGRTAGSGSTGGRGEPIQPTDRAELIRRADAGDREALAKLRESQPKGRTVHGSFWERQKA